MILNKQGKTNIDRWKITLIKRTHNSDGSYLDKLLEQTKLPSGTNYIHFPAKYRKMEYPSYYLINIEGLDAGDNVVASELSVHLNDNNNINDYLPQTNGGIPYIETECRKTCNGKKYAYHIQQFKQLYADLSFFRVVQAYKAFDSQSQTVNPYYWYSSQDIPIATVDPTYKVGPFISGLGGNVTVYDGSGIGIQGIAYGYKKTLGVWGTGSFLETNGNHVIGNEFCGTTHTLNTAIQMINTNANFTGRPPLECIPHPGPFTSGGSLPGDNGSPHPTFKDFVKLHYDSVGNPDPTPITGSVISSAALNPEIIAFIEIKNLNNPVDLVTIDVANLYNANGTFNGFNISLEPSLYSFGFMFKDKGFWTIIGEFQNTTNLSLTQADMVDITIFPTPIIDNKFDIKAFAHASVKFNYELRDFKGELILSKKMGVHKDHEKTIKINDHSIPEGMLLHRFIFNDGSVKTIQTLKN